MLQTYGEFRVKVNKVSTKTDFKRIKKNAYLNINDIRARFERPKLKVMRKNKLFGAK
jgi:hypothetical protein